MTDEIDEILDRLDDWNADPLIVAAADAIRSLRTQLAAAAEREVALREACEAMHAYFEADEAAAEAREDGDDARADDLTALARARWQCIPDLCERALAATDTGDQP